MSKGFELLREQAAVLPMRSEPMHVTELLDLPDGLRQFLLWLMRSGEVSLPAVAAQLGQPDATATDLLAQLCAKGWLTSQTQSDSTTRYRPRLARRRASDIPGV